MTKRESRVPSDIVHAIQTDPALLSGLQAHVQHENRRHPTGRRMRSQRHDRAPSAARGRHFLRAARNEHLEDSGPPECSNSPARASSLFSSHSWRDPSSSARLPAGRTISPSMLQHPLPDELPDVPVPNTKQGLSLRTLDFRFPALFNEDGLPHYPSNRYLSLRTHQDSDLEAAQEQDRVAIHSLEGRARAEAVEAGTDDDRLCLPVFLSIALVLFPVMLICWILACVFALIGKKGSV